MNRNNFIIGLLLIVSSLNAQTWQRKEVGNNVSVSFPNDVKYELKSSNGKNIGYYVSKTENCLFMVMVMYDVIPNYPNFVNFKQDEQNRIIGILLDNFCMGKLKYSNSTAVTETMSINNNQVRKLSYSWINPVTGKSEKRFSESFVVANKLFSIECFYLNDNITSRNQKNEFFKSIKII